METTRTVGTLPARTTKYRGQCAEGCAGVTAEWFLESDAVALPFAEGFFGGHRRETGHAIEVVALATEDKA